MENTDLRSRTMRRVKGRDTGLEMVVRRLVHGMGYRYRLHVRSLWGKPDLVLSTRRKVIFVHGCFWHQHDCPRGARIPKSNRDYWIRKLTRNQLRDAENQLRLRDEGWDVLVIWECEVRDRKTLAHRVSAYLDRPGC